MGPRGVLRLCLLLSLLQIFLSPNVMGSRCECTCGGAGAVSLGGGAMFGGGDGGGEVGGGSQNRAREFTHDIEWKRKVYEAMHAKCRKEIWRFYNSCKRTFYEQYLEGERAIVAEQLAYIYGDSSHGD